MFSDLLQIIVQMDIIMQYNVTRRMSITYLPNLFLKAYIF